MKSNLSNLDDIFERLLSEEEELRAINTVEGAMGRNNSDYKVVYDLFVRLFNDAASIRSNPNAFITSSGQYNDKVINAYAKLMSLAMKGMTELNRMRNNDKMVQSMLDDHARDFAQSAAIELGAEVKIILDCLDNGDSSEEISFRLRRFMNKKIPEIFLRSATATLQSTKESNGLLH